MHFFRLKLSTGIQGWRVGSFVNDTGHAIRTTHVDLGRYRIGVQMRDHKSKPDPARIAEVQIKLDKLKANALAREAKLQQDGAHGSE